MKAVLSIAVGTAALVAGTVLAADPPAPAKSRAEVRQEAINAQASGQTNVGESPSYPATSTKPAPRTGKRKTRHRDAKAASTPAAPEARQ